MAFHALRRYPAAVARYALRHRRAHLAHRPQGQALVELAIVMPLLIGIVATLFQFGILFIAYLSMVHEMRDIGRWVAVHPDSIDGTNCSTANSLWQQACLDAPS